MRSRRRERGGDLKSQTRVPKENVWPKSILSHENFLASRDSKTDSNADNILPMFAGNTISGVFNVPLGRSGGETHKG